MKIALAQINTSMGALEANVSRISAFLTQAKAQGADLAVFPELCIPGYPPKDHVEQEGFVAKNREMLDHLAALHPDQRFIVGFIEPSEAPGKGRFNAAAYVENGIVRAVQRKALLPTYDVFDENRYFDRARDQAVFEILGKRVGVTICEDMWADEVVDGRILYDQAPVRNLESLGVDLWINISASPYWEGKPAIREKIVSSIVGRHGVPFVFVNLVGGNDELIFDGASFVMDSRRSVIARAKAFEEDLIVCDPFSSSLASKAPWPIEAEAWVAAALTRGLRDYVKKCGFHSVVLGLSGGIDSALVLLLAVDAVGAGNVTALMMPSPYNRPESLSDAEAMCEALGVTARTIGIEPMMRAFDASLADLFRGKPKDVTEENLQARIRGNLLMAHSNKFGSLLLSTGNKSELAVGYCTQYGDMAGGIAVISDLYKHDVYALARHLNRTHRAIPERVFTRAPSAELRPDQTDQDSLPPYDVLDAILERYIEEKRSVESIVATGFDENTVSRVVAMVDRNEFKRKQAAPGLKVSAKAFGAGRRMPIARGPA